MRGLQRRDQGPSFDQPGVVVVMMMMMVLTTATAAEGSDQQQQHCFNKCLINQVSIQGALRCNAAAPGA